MHPLILAASLAGQFVLAPPSPPPNPSPSAQAPAPAAAVPTPQGWGPPVAAAAAPAAFPIQPAAPAPAPLYTIVLQAAAAPQAAVPVFAPASSQFAPQAAPFVNPFVVAQTAPQQQGIGTVALVGATFVADNPWIFDRILAHWGQHLHQRGMPVLRLAPPGTVTAPAASAAVVSLGQPGAFSVVSGPQHHTRFGRWFWGE